MLKYALNKCTSDSWTSTHAFYNKCAPGVAGAAAMLGAILYKRMGSRGIMPIAGCRGGAHAGVKGQSPLDITQDTKRRS